MQALTIYSYSYSVVELALALPAQTDCSYALFPMLHSQKTRIASPLNIIGRLQRGSWDYSTTRTLEGVTTMGSPL
jgi:hypothetical protein